MKKKRYKQTFLIIAIFLFGVVNIYAETSKVDVQADSNVVAVVNGKTILYKEIKADQQIIQLGYAEELVPARMQLIVEEVETKRLAAKIQKIVFEKKIFELDITASEKEVNTRVEEMFRKVELDPNQANEMIEIMRITVDALEEWQENPSSADAIYNQKLASIISKEQWKTHQVCYNTPQKLKKMRRLIPTNIEDMKKNSRASTRNDLLYEKLRNLITRDILVSDIEISNAYKTKYSSLTEKPNLEHVRESLREEILFKKRQEKENVWWQNEYKKININIIDERLKEASKPAL